MERAICVFAFNRPQNLQRCLSALSVAFDREMYDIFVFIDGPRNQAEQPLVQSCVAIAQKFGAIVESIEINSYNKGLKNNILHGIDLVCRKYNFFVVIEDDIVVSRSFLRFAASCSTTFQNDSRVVGVCGDIDLGVSSPVSSLVFLPMASSWGWGTWSDRWRDFRNWGNPRDSLKKNRSFLHFIQFFGLKRYMRLWRNSCSGLVDSWLIEWQVYCMHRYGLFVYPPGPLVSNIGFHAGTHSSLVNPMRFYSRELSTLENSDFLFEDATVQLDFSLIEVLRRSIYTRLLGLASSLGTIRRRMRRLILILRGI